MAYKSTSKMPKKLKAKWVAALRSGKYKQTQRTLERLDENGNVLGNCCLGVLCRIQRIPGKKDPESCRTYFKDSDEYLPSSLLEAFGLSDDDQHKLAELNDEDGKRFRGIAQFIERNIATA